MGKECKCITTSLEGCWVRLSENISQDISEEISQHSHEEIPCTMIKLTPRISLILCHNLFFVVFFWRGLGNEMSYERSSSNFNIFLGTNWLKFAHRVYIQILASWNCLQNPPNSHLLLLFFATFVQNEKAAAACKPNTDLNWRYTF